MSEMRVRVVGFGDRKHYQLQWVDPITQRKRTKSSGIENTGRAKDRQNAERAAATLQAELERGQSQDARHVTWEQFRQRYELEVLASLAPRTTGCVDTVFNSLESILAPKRLADLTSSRLSHFQAELRNKRHLAETTIKSRMAHLMAALSWAHRIGILAIMPKVDAPRRSPDKMKGRPITLEEFERLLGKIEVGLLAVNEGKDRKRKPAKRPAVASVVANAKRKRVAAAKAAVPSWERYLRGLFLSGFRLTESLEVYWDRDDKLCIDLAGKRPMIRIPAELEKGGKDRLLPLAPEFAEFLLETPADQRTGPVFSPAAIRPGGKRLTAEHVCRIVSKIGEKANVKVGTKRNGKPKFASAHDLRRSFGERWAMLVMPQVLMELMRHESIETTLKFYVGRNAERTADVLWDVHAQKTGRKGNTPGNSDETPPTIDRPKQNTSRHQQTR